MVAFNFVAFFNPFAPSGSRVINFIDLISTWYFYCKSFQCSAYTYGL